MDGVTKGIILGLVQGFTEFLPVSSSGHLALANILIGGETDLASDLVLHLATLLAVLIYYRKDVAEVIKHPFCAENRFIVTASIPTAVCAVSVRAFFYDSKGIFLPLCFAITAVLLLSTKLFKPKATHEMKDDLFRASITTGLMQGLACFAGISRSGATGAALILSGVKNEEIGKHSFLLSVPVIIGSAAAELIFGKLSSVDPKVAISGAVTAFISGLLAIKVYEKSVKSEKVWLFAIYAFLASTASFFIVF